MEYVQNNLFRKEYLLGTIDNRPSFSSHIITISFPE